MHFQSEAKTQENTNDGNITTEKEKQFRLLIFWYLVEPKIN